MDLLCTKCDITKSAKDNFSKTKRNINRNGHSYWCRECTSKQSKIYRSKPDKKELQRKYQSSPEALARRRELNKRPETKRKLFALMLKNNYNLSIEEYDQIKILQNNCCAVCKQVPTGTHVNDVLQVDHDHLTGKVRGLLCSKCNTGAGQFSDNISIIRIMANYLEFHQRNEQATVLDKTEMWILNGQASNSQTTI